MIKREFYLNRMIHHMWNGEVKVITGIRRCGKSYVQLIIDSFLVSIAKRYDVKGKTYFKYPNTTTLISDSAMRD